MLAAFAAGAALIGAAPAPKLVEQLKPGEYLWAPEIAPAGPMTVIVSLAAQRAYVYRNGVPIAVSTISSGQDGHETPTGVFTILQKDPDHRSNIYSNAPMPFMQRLTWDGIALHAGKLPGYRASHGCVRLPLAFAKALFSATRLGITVIVTDKEDVPEVAPVGDLLEPIPDGHTNRNTYRWRPERAPAGPITILVSGRDARVIVLRNGVEIGSSPIKLDAPITATTAYVLRAIDESGPHWMSLALPGQPTPASAELTDEDRARGHLPDGFRAALEAIVVPGTTILVTRDTIASSGTGARVNLIEVEAPADALRPKLR
jgi:hypothetical protein